MGLKKHLRRITKALTCSRSIKLSLNIIYDVSRGALIFQTAFMRMYVYVHVPFVFDLNLLPYLN